MLAVNLLKIVEKPVYFLGIIPCKFNSEQNAYVLNPYFRIGLICKHLLLSALGFVVLMDIVSNKEKNLSFLNTGSQLNLTAILRILFRSVWALNELTLVMCIGRHTEKLLTIIQKISKMVADSKVKLSRNFIVKLLTWTFVSIAAIVVHFVTRFFEFGITFPNLVQCFFLDLYLTLLVVWCLYMIVLINCLVLCLRSGHKSYKHIFKYNQLRDLLFDFCTILGPLFVAQKLVLFFSLVIDFYYEYHVVVAKGTESSGTFVAFAIAACQSSEVPLVLLFAIYCILERANVEVRITFIS